MFLSVSALAQDVACINGLANGYACDSVDLKAFVPITDMGGSSSTEANDIWGWTDPSTGKEYALVGLSTGTAFVDISDPVAPIYLGSLSTHTNSSLWRDLKVFNDHVYIVSEASGHGMQIFDLTALRSVSNPPATFSNTAHYDDFGNAHNIVINEGSGFAYAVGTGTCGGGLHMIDINNPTSPSNAGCFSSDGYTHDAQCVMYSGPDTAHQGKEICVNSNEDTITIADVSNKSNVIQLAREGYPNSAYVHQGWFSEDQRYFYQNDELDEDGGNTRTIIWDLEDLDDPFIASDYFGPTKAIDHNLYVKGNLVYETNYTAGLRILDITDPEIPVEIGFFDTYPLNDATSFNGAWSNYPYFASGNIIVSSIEDGLFILRPDFDGGGGNNPPVAGFSSSCTLLSCNFTDTSSDSDGAVVSWSWDLGDGSTSTAQNPDNTYGSNGTYSVMLTVTDDLGATSSTSMAVTVNDGSGGGTMHVASISTTTLRGSGGGTVEATVVIEDDNGNQVDAATVTGTFSGDLAGSDSDVTNGNGEATLVSDFFTTRPNDLGICVDNITHGSLTYDPNANADPSFGCDNGGNATPTADFSFSTTMFMVTFADASTDSDGSIVSWSWDFGDGNTSSAQNPSNTYAAAGTYSVMLTVTDDFGATNATSKSVTISDGTGGGTIHIESITTAITRDGGDRFVEATFLIHDDAGNPVASATIDGTFGGDLSGTDSGTTDAGGIAVLQSNTFTARPFDLGVCADAVSHPSLTYDPAQNTEAGFDCSPTAASEMARNRDLLQLQTVPTEFSIGQNYPNPFNPTTLIDFSMPESAHVSIIVYNMLGQEMVTLANEVRDAGIHTVTLDAANLSAGVYLYVMETANFSVTKRMTLMK
ncbi:MAG: choice-of-anchor B family protein [Rhodothermales bacterium]